MAETPVYSGLGRELAGGVLTVDNPAQRAQEPDAPARREAISSGATTADVQRSAEAAVGDLQGAAVVVGLGPEVPEGADIPSGWIMTYDERGVRRRGFRVAETLGMMPLLRFAHAAKTGADTDDMEGMAALYTMIRDVVHEDDWDDFQEYATVKKIEDNGLLEFVGGAIEVISARKAQQRGSSSGTSPRTSGRSRDDSSRPGSAIPTGTRVPEEADGLMAVSDLVKR